MLRRSCAPSLLAVALLFAPAAAAGPIALSPDPTYPDFWQRDSHITNGSIACGPTAATDSLYWLANRYGLPNLEGSTWQAVDNLLGSASFMQTWSRNSTYSGYFLSGETRYVQSLGDQSELNVHGLLAAGSDAPPTVAWLENELARGAAVDVEIGWIRDNPPGQSDTWVNGHFVALTGYDSTGFYISDPWINDSSNQDRLSIYPAPVSLTFSFDAFGNSRSPYTKAYTQVRLGPWDIGSTYDEQVIFAAIAIDPIPEPATLVLAGVTVLLMAAFRGVGSHTARRTVWSL